MKFYKIELNKTKRKIITLALGLVVGTGLVNSILPDGGILNVVATATGNVESRKLPIYCVGTEEPKISISFDAAWGADDTEELLSILEANDVKTTFFLCGYWVEDFPEEVKMIAEAGHDIGNHSSTHPHMNELTSEQITKELQECHEAVKSITGIEMNLFRPPFGEYNNTVIETSYENNYFPVQWDVDRVHIKRKR